MEDAGKAEADGGQREAVSGNDDDANPAPAAEGECLPPMKNMKKQLSLER